MRLDDVLPLPIRPLCSRDEMRLAVEFDRQLELGGIEIGVVRFDPELSAKLAAQQLAVLELGPEDDFRRRHVVPQVAPSVGRLGTVEMARHGRVVRQNVR